MAILIADIAAYLASISKPIQPASKPSVKINKRDVKYMPSFDVRSVKPDWSGGNMLACVLNSGINEYVEGLKVVEIGPELEFFETIDTGEMAEAIIAQAATVQIDELSPLAWAIQNLSALNPWDLLTAGKLIELSHTPGGDLAIEAILKDALLQLQTYGDKIRPEVESMARMVIRMARTDLLSSQDEVMKIVENPDGMEAIVRIHKIKDENAVRPADVYRAWMRPLRLLKSVGCHLWTLIDDIIASQTLPFGELDAPAWIDRYTGIADKVEAFVNIQTSDEATELTLEEVAQSNSESFNSDDGLGAEEDDQWSGEVIGEEPIQGVTFDMQNDYKASPAFDELRKESWSLVNKCRVAIAQLQKQAKSYATLGLFNDEGACEWKSEWVKKEFRKSSEALEFLDWMRLKARPEAKTARKILAGWSQISPEHKATIETVQDVLNFLKKTQPTLFSSATFTTRSKATTTDGKKVQATLGKYTVPAIDEAILAIRSLKMQSPADGIVEPLRELTRGAEPEDLLLLFLGLDSDFGFDDEDMSSIRVCGAHYANLLEYYREFGDSILDSMGDGYYRKETSDELVNLFAEDTLKRYADKCPVDGNPVQSRPYVDAFLRSAVGATALTTKDKDGKWHNSATTAGWEAWRQSKSPEGNLAYHKALAEGKSHEEAMVAFKAITKTERGEKIVQVMPSGLVLASGRKVNYHVATLKYKAKELNIKPDDADRLMSTLEGKGWGTELVKAMQNYWNELRGGMTDAELDQVEWTAQNA